MEGISDLRIIGMDERRPPVIRKEPYIDLYFELTHKAPADWCNDFNNLLSKHPATPKIKAEEGLFIEAWVRTPDAIVEILNLLKGTITECSRQYIEKIELSARSSDDNNTTSGQATGEQGRLNAIISALDFDEIKVH